LTYLKEDVRDALGTRHSWLLVGCFWFRFLFSTQLLHSPNCLPWISSGSNRLIMQLVHISKKLAALEDGCLRGAQCLQTTPGAKMERQFIKYSDYLLVS